MQYIIKCTRRNFSWDASDEATTYDRFFGPFPDKRSAEIDILIEKALNICDGTHTILEVQKVNRDDNWAKGVNIPSLIRSVVEESKADIVEEMARQAEPFVADNDGENRRIPVTFDNLKTHKIATIKTLRNRYPGLGLRNAKDIVDGWQRDREPLVAI